MIIHTGEAYLYPYTKEIWKNLYQDLKKKNQRNKKVPSSSFLFSFLLAVLEKVQNRKKQISNRIIGIQKGNKSAHICKLHVFNVENPM